MVRLLLTCDPPVFDRLGDRCNLPHLRHFGNPVPPRRPRQGPCEGPKGSDHPVPF